MCHEIINLSTKFSAYRSRLFFLLVAAALVIAVPSALAQTSSSDTTSGDYEVTSSVELGVRAISFSGNENKFRSDLNYRNGFRVFDSSVMVRSKSGRDKFFDTFTMNGSGFGADRNGFARFSLEKTGMYRLDGNVRRIDYYNNLANFARSQHNRNTNHYLGDFDFTAYPIGEKLQINFGASFDRSKGPGTWTTRGFRSNASDEWAVDVNNDNRASDVRGGVAGDLGGFDLSLTHGYRRFKDNTFFSINSLNQGLNPTNNSTISSFVRQFPIKGTSNYTVFNAHRTFAKRADFTGRLIYSNTRTLSQLIERITGRDSANNFVDLDSFDASGEAKRIEKRGDFGLTVMATDRFRISETFTFNTFGIDGGLDFFATTVRRSSAGVPQVVAPQTTSNYRLTDYRRFINTLEADYQINKYAAFHIGWRYTHRSVELKIINNILTSPPSATNPDIESEEESNSAHVGFVGMKISPTKNWVIFWDAEHGNSDNAFTRLANYKFTNLRARTRWNYKKFSLSLSGITKDNENPSFSSNPQSPSNPATGGSFIGNTKGRTFAGSVDWTPVEQFSFSGGYSYQRLISETDIVINVGSLQRGTSTYYMKDHSAFFDISARPNKWVSLFASYRRTEDLGQGDRVQTIPNFLISSYPFISHAPEARVAFRLTKNIDWNIGYQYFGYNENIFATMPLRVPPFTTQPPPLLVTDVPGSQYYHAHLPYTSLRIYFGGNDR